VNIPTTTRLVRAVLAAAAAATAMVATLGFAGDSKAHVVETMTATIGHAATARPEAAAHPALGFELGQTRRSEAMSCSQMSALNCEVLAMGSTLRCSDGALTMRFDGDGTLVSVDVVEKGLSRSEAKARFEATNAELSHQVGPATDVVNDAAFVERNYERVERSYRYRGYDAVVTATSLGAEGVQIREQYRLWR
jgi:hypothetical protein